MPGVAESPWQRPAETSPAASIVSPFAPTVPQETYKPVPGDPIYEHPTNPDPKKRKTLPNAPRRSFLPLLLIALGILVLLAILLYSSTA